MPRRPPTAGLLKVDTDAPACPGREIVDARTAATFSSQTRYIELCGGSLVISGADEAEDLDFLRTQGVTHIINCISH